MSLETLTKVVNSIRSLDVGTAAAKLMMYLAAVPKPGATVRGAAEDLGLSKPGVTRAMQQLYKQGLATQVRDPHDHRSVYLFLTADGVKQINKMTKLFD